MLRTLYGDVQLLRMKEILLMELWFLAARLDASDAITSLVKVEPPTHCHLRSFMPVCYPQQTLPLGTLPDEVPKP